VSPEEETAVDEMILLEGRAEEMEKLKDKNRTFTAPASMFQGAEQKKENRCCGGEPFK